MALRELVTVLRYELQEGNLKKYVQGYEKAEKAVTAAATAATSKLNKALSQNVRTTDQIARSTTQVARGMNRVVHETRQFAAGLRDGARQGYGEVLRQMDRVEARQRRMRRQGGAAGAGQSIGMLGGVIQGVVAGLSLRTGAEASDEWASARSRIGLQTADTATRDRSVEFLFRQSQRTGQSYAPLADTFVAMARGREALGLSNDQTLQMSGVVSQLMAIGGGSAASQEAALTQFGQAMNTGVLRGEELNSILEQAPRLAQAIAEAMGTSVGGLRKLGEEGKITAREISTGLLRQTEKVQSEFERMPMTFARSGTMIRNQFVRRVGELNDRFQLADRFNQVARVVINNMERIGAAVALIAGSWVAVRVFRGLAVAFDMISRGGRVAILFFDRLAGGRYAQAFAKLGRSGLLVLRIFRAITASLAAVGIVGAGGFALLAGLIVAVALLVYRYWRPIKAFFSGLWSGLSAGLDGAGAQLAAVFGPLMPAIQQLGRWLADSLAWLVRMVDPANATANGINSAADAGMALGVVVAAALRGLIDVVGFLIDRFVALGTWIGETAGWIVISFENAWGAIRAGVASLWEWITGRFRAGWQAVAGLVPGWLRGGMDASIGSAGGPNWTNVTAGQIANAGRSPVSQNVTNTASVSITAPPGANAAAYGQAAKSGTSRALSSFGYQLPMPVEQL